MTSKDLRQKYIEFFKSHGHTEIPPASLIPENDPSVLFTTAGMSPLVPFLLGEKHPAGSKLVNSQKCIRTGDIEEVGDATHHTFFEMLGHWSLGDYFKEEAITLSWQFLTEKLKLDRNFLAFTVFVGDENASKDEAAASAWKKNGVSEKRIAYLPKKDNWWELVGSSGPCGPCTEMFYWTGDKDGVPEDFDPENKKWVEIGNDVLMQYEKMAENKYKTANQKNIDNGTGLERLLAVMNGFDDNYKTDLFWPIIQKIEELSVKKYDESLAIRCSMRIIADHLRAATFIMADSAGIVPSNTDQGYVARKLIRRAIRHAKSMGIDKNFCAEIAIVIIDNMKDIYLELETNKKFVIDNLNLEEDKFNKTLQDGLKEFAKLAEKYKSLPAGMASVQAKKISGAEAFNLFQTYGFPIELIKELSNEKYLEVDETGFKEEMQKHQDLSRTASAGKFKGGLANQSVMAIKYHTASHLLLAALRQVLGEHVFQKGSNITDERLRLDFSHFEKMTKDQIEKVTDIVNKQIKNNFTVECQEMSLEEAKETKAMGVFENKYGDRVKVYTVGDKNTCFSKEICGGPHVKETGELGSFKIIKEEASSSGVRRIKAVLE